MIAVLKTEKNYDGISEGYKNCFESINQFIRQSEISIKGVTYKLEFFLCCDYKVSVYSILIGKNVASSYVASYIFIFQFTLMLLGLQAANSKHACA